MNLTSKRILVVGASGVLGAEITRMLTAKGAQVLGTARTQESAAKIPAETVLRLLVDLADPNSITNLTHYLVANETLDGIVIASGRVGFGLAADTTPQQAQSLMQVNHLGPAQLISELLSLLKGKEEPMVAAITGVVAEKSFPGMSAYCASKTALASWLGALALEVRRDQIKITDLRPGHTETGLASRPLFGAAPAMPQGMSATQVAERIVTALEQGEGVVASTEF